MNRRTFLTTTSAAIAAAAFTPAARAATYRAAVIGDSDRGGYGHNLHRMWGLRDDIDTVALSDPNAAGRAKHAAECGAENTYADYQELLAKEKPDLVAVGPRWTVHHEDYMRACADAGAHGIIEKPLASDLATADKIIEAVNDQNLKWAIAFNFRASPIIDHARKLIVDDGLIGQVLEIRSRGKEDHRAGGEDLIVLGVHLFDLMRYFFGDPSWCFANIEVDGRRAEARDVREASEPLGPIVGDSLQAMWGFDNNVTAHFASVKNTDGNKDRWGMEIYGTRGVVSIRMSEWPRVHYRPDPSWAPGNNDAKWQPLPDAPEPPTGIDSPVWHYKPIVDDLIAAIEEDRAPKVSIEDGRAATAMIQSVWESHVQGGPVQFPLNRREHPLAAWSA